VLYILAIPQDTLDGVWGTTEGGSTSGGSVPKAVFQVEDLTEGGGEEETDDEESGEGSSGGSPSVFQETNMQK
jgi:hypothetical protein